MLLNETIGEVKSEQDGVENLFVGAVGLERMLNVLQIADHRHFIREFTQVLAIFKFFPDHVLERICFELGKLVVRVQTLIGQPGVVLQNHPFLIWQRENAFRGATLMRS